MRKAQFRHAIPESAMRLDHESEVTTSSRQFIKRPIFRKKRILSVDLDGTVADITKRKEYALQFGPDGSVQFYEAFLDGRGYDMDAPVVSARDFLNRYVQETKGEIAYLSGRRKGTESETLAWLTKHQFPTGAVIHRPKGHRSLDFKCSWIHKFKESKWVDAHIGDRIEDDGKAAHYSGVRFVHIVDHQWPTLDEFFSASRKKSIGKKNPE
jgi:predicted secreted acid phosphatase